jgi:hypothetical protein
MADPTTYHRVKLDWICPKLGKTTALHTWSQKFSLSGAAIPDLTAFEATALDLAAPTLMLGLPGQYLSKALYYPAGATVSSMYVDYDSTDQPCTGSAWISIGPDNLQQSEVCVLATVGTGRSSSTGKATYLHKYIHFVPGRIDTDGVYAGGVSVDPFVKWNTGSGPADLVPVSPTTGAIPTNVWGFPPYLVTRQMRLKK